VSAPDPFAGRVTELNDAPVRNGDYVLYWMQRSQRASYNHALEYAVRLANERKLPLVVGFGLTADYPDANRRHYRFMLEGLQQTERTLRERGIPLVVRIGEPLGVALDLGREAAAIVCDRGYLSYLREWRAGVGRTASCHVVEVESDLAVPVEEVSSKQEFAARTIRPKIHRRLGEYLTLLEEQRPTRAPDALRLHGEPLTDLDALLRRLRPAEEPDEVSRYFRGGYDQARARLDRFIKEKLDDYEEKRSEPGLDVSSRLSPYLHFGQISALEIALAVGALQFVEGLEEDQGRMENVPGSVGMRTSSERTASARDAFLEELLVRRGLAYNFVWYARDYAHYRGLPDWARATLHDHQPDERPELYSMDELVAAETHDEYWNNAMREMKLTGYMHNYMRMYWGKKILEWTGAPEKAYYRVLELNNRWFLDGRDANSYANVGWVFGLHDRPWTERDVFGKVRYMNANGLKRKFDMDLYAEKIERLKGEA